MKFKSLCLTLVLSTIVWLADGREALANNYGAIAFSPSTGAFGRSWDYSTRRQAERRAMRGCRKHARDCRVLWFRNACGAVALAPNGGWGQAWASTKNGAQNRAMGYCRQHNRRGCYIRVWQCTTR